MVTLNLVDPKPIALLAMTGSQVASRLPKFGHAYGHWLYYGVKLEILKDWAHTIISGSEGTLIHKLRQIDSASRDGIQ